MLLKLSVSNTEITFPPVYSPKRISFVLISAGWGSVDLSILMPSECVHLYTYSHLLHKSVSTSNPDDRSTCTYMNV